MTRPLRRLITVIALAVLALTGPLIPSRAAPPDAPSARGGAPLTRESGCVEFAYARGALASVIRPLVPARFELVPFFAPTGTAPRVDLRVNEVVCRTVENLAPARSRQRRVTSIIVSANVDADGFYVLAYATENRDQARAFNRLGWATDLLDRSGAGTLEPATPGGLTRGTITMAGAGWDHRTDVVAVGAEPARTASVAAFFRDTDRGPLALCFENVASSVGAIVTGDLTTTPLAGFTAGASRPLLVAFGAAPFPDGTYPPVNLLRGGWTSTLRSGSCSA